jgi:light-regulated signal transduction histidine kinase (bacteriophytochrome)
MPLSESEKGQLKEALHRMNNALNSISMQAELAKMYAEQNNNAMIGEALEVIMSQCRQCSAITQGTHALLREEG